MSSTVTIERLGAQGDGVAMTGNGQVFVPFALPGERVNVAMGEKKADLVAVLEASPLRVEPACRHFGTCGGCAMQHLEESAYREWKRERLVEALRATQAKGAPPGLLGGLADARVAEALRHMHGDPERQWTVAELAGEAGMSRSAFFDRFMRTVGLRPMEYLLAWRMAVAKDLLRSKDIALDEVARRVGYGSASTFSTAFSRHVGQPPGRYARGAMAF